MNLKVNKINKCKKKRIRATKLKITIVEEKGRVVRLPAIPFWIVEKLAGVSIFIMRSLNKAMWRRIRVTEKEIKIIFESMKQEPPFTLVEVEDRKGNFIEIKTL